MKKYLMIGMAFLLAMCLGMQDTNGQQKKKDKSKKLMIDKLRYAKQLLEAVSKNNYVQMGKTAQKLIELSNRLEWRVHKTARYKLHSDDFREAANNLKKQAKKKNQDGVAFAYLELTMTCFRCHQSVREIQDVDFSRPDLGPGTTSEIRK